MCCVSSRPFLGWLKRLDPVDSETDDFPPAPVLFLRRALL